MKAIQVKKTACPLGKLKPVVGDRMWTRSAGGRWREMMSLMMLSSRLETLPINMSQPARRSRTNMTTTATAPIRTCQMPALALMSSIG